MSTARFTPPGLRPDGYRPENFRPGVGDYTGPAGYHIISQPTADVDAVKTTLSIEPAGTTSYLLTGTPDSVQWVFVRCVSACAVGDGEPIRPKLRRVAFDASGNLIPDVPNAPIKLTLTPGPGGTVTATWAYMARGQMEPPASFNIYTAVGAAAFDFDTPAGNVAHTHAPSFTATFAHGVTARFVVRAVSAAGKAAGGEEPNTIEASAVADAQAPAAPIDLIVKLIP